MSKKKIKTSKKTIVNLIAPIALIVLFIGNAFIPLYPLRMFIVCIMALIFLVLMVISIIKNSQTKKGIKVLFCIILSILMVVFSYQAYLMIEDVVKGPKESIITNITVKNQTTSGKYKTTHHYIIGTINGKEVKLKIVRNWKEVMDEARKSKAAMVRYYKNASSIDTIEFY